MLCAICHWYTWLQQVPAHEWAHSVHGPTANSNSVHFFIAGMLKEGSNHEVTLDLLTLITLESNKLTPNPSSALFYV